MDSKLFFVYGSLKTEGHNNPVLRDSHYMGEYITMNEYLLTDIGFPYLIPKSGYTEATGHPTLPVVGELYEVTDKQVEEALDQLEGVKYGHYKRQNIFVKGYASFEVHNAIAYIPCDQEYAAGFTVCQTVELSGTTCYYW